MTQARHIWLIEIGITNKNILPITETIKARKYDMLANELKCIHKNTKVTTIPVVLTWDGLVS